MVDDDNDNDYCRLLLMDDTRSVTQFMTHIHIGVNENRNGLGCPVDKRKE